MKILYLTDIGHMGPLTSSFQMGPRPPMSWIGTLNSFHCPYFKLNELQEDNFDITIIGCIHENVDVFNIDLEKIKKISKKILFQHDSDHRYFYQKNSLHRSYMLNYIISNVDAILAHNDLDKKYYETLYKKPCFIHEQLILDVYNDLPYNNCKHGVILGGITDRYGALDGYTLITNSTDEEIYCFGDNENIPGVTFIPNIWDYIEYNNKLSGFKYAFNLTPLAIGGSFPLQCAMVKTPCLGWDNSNPLKTCFPDLVVPYGDFDLLREKFTHLINNNDFYNYVVDYARDKFVNTFNVNLYKTNLNKIFISL